MSRTPSCCQPDARESCCSLALSSTSIWISQTSFLDSSSPDLTHRR